MNVLQTSGIVAVGLLFGGLGGMQVERIIDHNIALLSSGSQRAPADSPVVVVGGSITAHTTGKWDCSSSPCVSGASPNLNQLSLVGVAAQSADEPFAWGNITENWTVEVLDRNPKAMAGLKICSNMACSGTGLLTSPGPVYLQPEDPTTSGFYGVDAPNGKGRNGKRFQDKTTGKMSCQNQSVDQDFCEKIQTIRVTINGVLTTYDCPDGACKIEVGP